MNSKMIARGVCGSMLSLAALIGLPGAATFAFAQEAAPASDAEAAKPAADATGAGEAPVLVVDTAFESEGRSFTMQVPSDWEVKKDYAGYEFFMQPMVKVDPTAENPVVADPNITVKVLRAPIVIDKQGLDEYEAQIRARFNESNGAGSELNIFSKQLQELPGGRRGLLYYYTFKKNTYDVVSAVLVMSNDTALYRVTLTDYKVGFDKNLERYFPVMASLKVPGEPLARVDPLEAALPYAGSAAAIAVLLTGIFYVRNRRMKALLSSTNTSGRKRNVEDMEGQLLRGKTGRSGKKSSRPPESAMGSSVGSSMGSAMGSSMGDAMGSSMGSAMGSSMGSAMGSSMGSAMGSSMGSGMGSSKGTSGGSAAASGAPSRATQGKAAQGCAAQDNAAQGSAASAAPHSAAFPMSSFGAHEGNAPVSQPLSHAFGGPDPSVAGKGFAASEAPRSNKPLPSKKKAEKENKHASGFPMSEYGDDDK